MSIAKYIAAGLGAASTIAAAPPAQWSASSQWSASTASVTGVSAYNTALPTVVPASTVSVDASAAAAAASAAASLGKTLNTDVTNVQRFNDLLTVNGAGKELLPADQLKDRVVFDFGAKAAPAGKGGRLVQANAGNFPILVGEELAAAVFFLNPCSLNSPHIHPRATEFLTVVQGNLRAGFMLENGFLPDQATGALTTQVSSQLGPFQGTVFPKGSIHWQFNPTCDTATFVAGFDNNDPGTSQIAQNFFFINDQIVNITLGEPAQIDGSNIDEFRLTLPPNLVQDIDQCLAQCGH